MINFNYKREKTIRLAEHEVMISFGDDDSAEAFLAWFADEGKDALEEYCRHNSDFCHLVLV